MTIRINIFLELVLAFLTLGCGGAFADDNSSTNYLDLRRCFDFSWTRMHDDRHSRAAIMVLVEINGQRGYMQLDTGAPKTALYGAVTDRSGLTVPPPGESQAAQVLLRLLLLGAAFTHSRPP